MPCANLAKKKELISRKQIAGQKSKKFTYSSPLFYHTSTAKSTSNAPRWSVDEKVSCQFPRALADCLARSPKIVHKRITSYGLLQSSISNDMTSAQLRAPSLAVRLNSSEEGKSETLRLGLRVMSNEIFCPKCRTKLGCPRNEQHFLMYCQGYNNLRSELHSLIGKQMLILPL